MESGRLRHLITIQSLVPEQDPVTGIITDTRPTFATVYAEFIPATAKELIAAGIEQQKITAAFKIYYLSGVKQSMQIVHGEQTFQIEGVMTDPNSGREYMVLPVTEVSGG